MKQTTEAMKITLHILLFFAAINTFGQSKSELQPDGSFTPVEETIAAMTNEKFIEGTQLWISEFTRGQADITEVTENSLTIDAFRDNAFLYTSLGESYLHNVKYQLKIRKEGNKYFATFQVLEIHSRKVILKSTLADYFTSDGKMKEDFKDVKPSMDRTVNIILGSYYRYISKFRS